MHPRGKTPSGVAKKCVCGRRRALWNWLGLTPHDLRRSAAKAARRAGVAESVIMQTGGWKTAAMFRRYAIVSSADQKDAVTKIERARKLAKTESPDFSPASKTATVDVARKPL